MYAVLGQTEFQLITYFDGLEVQFGVEFAEHALVGRKPRLQFVGEKLDEVRWELVFHTMYCDPEAELLKLRQAMMSREARQFVLGNGTYKGWMVITSVTATSRQTDKAGTLIALDATVVLREYVVPRTPDALQSQAIRSASARRQAAPKKQGAPAVLDAKDGFALNGRRGAGQG